MDILFVFAGLFYLGSIVCTCILAFVLIVALLRRKNAKKWAKRFGFSFLCIFLSFALGITLAAITSDEDEAKDSTSSTIASSSETQTETTIETCTPSTETVEPNETIEVSNEPGENWRNPIIVTVEEFANEIKADISAASDKYNGKWIQITGRVTDYSRYNSSSLSGYYLYGKYAQEGLRVVCWQNKKAEQQFLYVGRMCVCIGKVSELSISTTELVNCDISFE